jgi:predicted DNA-binding transcriptional regulator AlpA
MVTLLTRRQAAELLALKEQTLARWAMLGKGPRFVKCGSRAVRYRPADIERYIAANIVGGTQPAESEAVGT